MNKCSNCGFEFDGKFCPECGTKFSTEKTCPTCGKVVPADTKFCSECGYSFKTTTPIAAAPTAPVTPVAPAQPTYGAKPNYGAPQYGAKPTYGAQPNYAQPAPAYAAPGYGEPSDVKAKIKGALSGIFLAIFSLLSLIALAMPVLVAKAMGESENSENFYDREVWDLAKEADIALGSLTGWVVGFTVLCLLASIAVIAVCIVGKNKTIGNKSLASIANFVPVVFGGISVINAIALFINIASYEKDVKDAMGGFADELSVSAGLGTILILVFSIALVVASVVYLVKSKNNAGFAYGAYGAYGAAGAAGAAAAAPQAAPAPKYTKTKKPNRFLSWLGEHKVGVIVVSIILVVVIVACIILIPMLFGDKAFKVKNLKKIEIGASESRVEKVIGEATMNMVEDGDGEMIYIGGDAKKYAKDFKKAYEKYEKAMEDGDYDELEKLAEELDELSEKIENCNEVAETVVYFENGEVVAIEYRPNINSENEPELKSVTVDSTVVVNTYGGSVDEFNYTAEYDDGSFCRGVASYANYNASTGMLTWYGEFGELEISDEDIDMSFE